MKENRAENRLLCADLIEVRWLDAQGDTQSTIANLECVSTTTLGLILEVEVPPGTPLLLRTTQTELRARVSECHHEPDIGYALALDLLHSAPGTRQRFRPRHLFDPRGLARRQAERSQSGPPTAQPGAPAA